MSNIAIFAGEYLLKFKSLGMKCTYLAYSCTLQNGNGVPLCSVRLSFRKTRSLSSSWHRNDDNDGRWGGASRSASKRMQHVSMIIIFTCWLLPSGFCCTLTTHRDPWDDLWLLDSHSHAVCVCVCMELQICVSPVASAFVRVCFVDFEPNVLVCFKRLIWMIY